MSNIQSLRTEKDRFFVNDPQSPLTLTQKQDFTGLHYFPENPALRLVVDVDVFPVQEPITIQTTGGRPQPYRRFGRFRFDVDGQTVQLTIYATVYGYFLPFVDNLAGQETYPAGRYLEPQKLSNGKFLIDFNLAYNPYCAYNDQWSCPITPAENRLKVPICAGEKVFHSQSTA